MSDKIITYEKERKFRNRKPKEWLTKTKLADEEKHHPLRQPYEREKLKWVPTTSLLGDEEEIEEYFLDEKRWKNKE